MAAGYRVTGATVASRESPRADLRSAQSYRYTYQFFLDLDRETFFSVLDGNAVEDVKNANVKGKKEITTMERLHKQAVDEQSEKGEVICVN